MLQVLYVVDKVLETLEHECSDRTFNGPKNRPKLQGHENGVTGGTKEHLRPGGRPGG